jgi:hypothetical protein
LIVFPHTSQILILIPNYKRLKIHYGDSIVVQIQRGQGKSNPVFSSDVSIGHVVATAGNLKSKIKTSEIKQEISTVADSCNDDQILHAAIRILRHDIEKISISTDEYPTANEVSLALSMDRMPLSLTKFTFLQCNIHRNYGFIRVLSQTLRMGVFSFPYIRSAASSILFYVAFYQLHMPSQDALPHHPCSGSANEPFLKYLKRASLQINIWMTAHVAKPPMNSAVLFGWEDRNGLVPVYFKGQMSSDFLQDLVCSCKGKSVCMKGCICF